MKFIFIACLLMPIFIFSKDLANEPTIKLTFEKFCYECHDEDVKKGDVRLDNLATMDLAEKLVVLNRVQEQIFLGDMPPKKKKQPSEQERKLLLEWIAGELKEHNASKLEDKMQKPEYANYVPHDKLFSGEFKDLPGFTYDRRWLISEYIYDAKIQRIFGANDQIRGQYRMLNMPNPFPLPKISGVRYYANEAFGAGHLSTLLTNVEKYGDFVTNATVKDTKKKLAISQILGTENDHNAILAFRKNYLEQNIAQICEEMYGNENEALLPIYKPMVLPVNDPNSTVKKAPYHAAVPKGKDIFEVTLGLSPHNENRQAVSLENKIRPLEKKWFHYGEEPIKISMRVNFMALYMDEYWQQVDFWKTYTKFKIPAPIKISEAELAIIKNSIKKHRAKGDFYVNIINKCLEDWSSAFKAERMAQPEVSDQLLGQFINEQYMVILQRMPSATEQKELIALARNYMKKMSTKLSMEKIVETIMLSSEFVYRDEYGEGQGDEHGRRMLSPMNAAFAIAYALTDHSPDKQLMDAANTGKLNTREDYKREIIRMLNDRSHTYYVEKNLISESHQLGNTTDLPIRKLRFFRDFFGYPLMLNIFKDEKRFGASLKQATFSLIDETDFLVETILKKDKNVFEELLTTEEFFVYHNGDNTSMQASSDKLKVIYEYFKDKNWQKFTNEDLLKHKEFLVKNQILVNFMEQLENGDKIRQTRGGGPVDYFKTMMSNIEPRFDKGQKNAPPFGKYQALLGNITKGRRTGILTGELVARFFNFSLDNWDYPTEQPFKVANRKGLLTHPAWLMAFARNTETDPIHRGKWIREKLLAGYIPSVPITVDAVIPENHELTLRDRLAKVTEVEYCWRCHELMNPLGNAFEMYDDFGRFRTEESLEYPVNLVSKTNDKGNEYFDRRDIYKTLPVKTTGFLEGTKDAALDGEVKNAIELAEKLGKSRLVRQSIIRHAFRYFLGRNETLSDSKTLIDAEGAYSKSGGSFDAVIVSLLTSDSFIYRKPIKEK